MRFGILACTWSLLGVVGGALGCGAKSDLFGPTEGAGAGAGASAGGSGGSGAAGAGGVGGSGGSVGGSPAGGTGGVAPGCMPGDEASCYEGPPGTLGVGQCTLGFAQCGPDGMFGPCTGQVLPSPEICGNAVDEDCDGVAPACGGEAWSAAFSGDAFPIGMATDIDGGAVILGGLVGDVTFAPGLTFSGEGHTDLFVVRLSSGGNVTWARHFPAEGFGVAAIGSLEIDPQQQIVIAGGAESAVDFGDGLVPGTGSFVAKLDMEGKPLWAKRLKDSWVRAAAGKDGSVTAVGWGEPIGGFQGQDGVHLTKLDGAGNLIWEKTYAPVTWLHPMGIDVDSTGASYLVAELIGNAQLGPITASCPTGCALLAKHDANGTPLWAQVFVHDQVGGLGITYPVFFGTGATQAGYNGTAGATGHAVRVAPDDSVLFSGTFGGSLSLGGAPLTGGGANLFLAKLDAAGNHQWSRAFGGPLANTPGAFTVNAAGQVLVSGMSWSGAGGFPGQLDFGGGPLPIGLGVGKLDSTGTPLASHGYVGGYPESWLQVSADQSSGMFLALRASEPIDLGDGPVQGMIVMRTQP